MKPTAFLDQHGPRRPGVRGGPAARRCEPGGSPAPASTCSSRSRRRANPLFDLDNVVVTPHAAGVDVQSRDDMALSAAQAIVSLCRGEWPAEKVVNPEVKARFRW